MMALYLLPEGEQAGRGVVRVLNDALLVGHHQEGSGTPVIPLAVFTILLSCLCS